MDKGFGKYDVYAVAGSMYCYRGTSVWTVAPTILQS